MSSGYLYAIGAAITWGLVYTFDQRILKGSSPFTLLFIDSIITAVILLPIIFFDRSSIHSMFTLSGKTWIFIILSLIWRWNSVRKFNLTALFQYLS